MRVAARRGAAERRAARRSCIRGIVGHLAQRLQVEDWYRRHPEIDDVPIEAPLFGLGLPRTGSTALSFLLAQDPDIRYLRQWESSQPCPPPSTVRGAGPAHRAGGRDRPAPGPTSRPTSSGPMECLDLHGAGLQDADLPGVRPDPVATPTWLLDADLTSTYLYERRVLKLLQWGEPARPWRLKTPAHVLFLDVPRSRRSPTPAS